MIKLCMPYDVPVKELSNGLKSLGFEPRDFMTSSVLNSLETLLVMRDGSLDVIKNRDNVIKRDVSFIVIDISDGKRDLSDEIGDNRNVILSLNGIYQWFPGDNFDKYEPKKGDSFIDVEPKKGLGEMDILWMCIELSYRFGCKFFFYTNEKDYILTFDKDSISKKYILDCLVNNKKDIEKTYGVKMSITRNCIRKMVSDFDDFD